MNQNRFQGLCMQFKGRLKEYWGRQMNDPQTSAAGRNERFEGRILEQRGISAAQADRQLVDFLRRNRNWWDLSRH